METLGADLSWDLIVFSEEAETESDAEGRACFRPDWTPPPFASHDSMRAAISAVFPDTDWTDPHWGGLQREDFALEFALGKEVPSTFTIIGHGAAIAPVFALIEATGWLALDTSSGRWLEIDAPREVT